MGMAMKVLDANGEQLKLNNYVKRAKSGRYLGRVVEINPISGWLRVETSSARLGPVLIHSAEVKLS